MTELVYIEHNGELLKFNLTPAEAARANTDQAFVINLISKQLYARRRNMKIQNSQIINEAIDTTPTEATNEVLLVASSVPCSANSVQENEDSSVIESDKALFIWPSKSVYLLLQKYEERMNEFSSGTKRHSKIWENIASDMNQVDSMISVLGTQCQSKMNSLKKMYKKVIDHNNISGNDRKSWQYFERMDELFGKSGWANPIAIASDAGPSSANSTDDNKSDKEEPATKKLKSEKVLDEFVKEIKKDRQEREKKREEKKLAALQELKDQKEKQHREKMDIMKKFYEVIAGKKLFD